MDRRAFLGRSLAGAGAVAGAWLSTRVRDVVGEWGHDAHAPSGDGPRQITAGKPPSYSIIPVVGDGKWIWTEPPTDETGYLESRAYRARVGIELVGTGFASGITATTTAPIACPEQKIENFKVSTQGCQAKLRSLTDGSAQLILSAGEIQPGQTISAAAEFELTISKQWHGYKQEMFPSQQKLPREIQFGYLKDSPGIQTMSKEVQALATELSKGAGHPWDKALRFHEWVPQNIKAQIGPYTSVRAALEKRVGDCEERSAVFVALCRAVGIPARLVWVPNHNWSEIYLVDHSGKGHWIPVHTSCYPWFGWVGAHELVLQKGDRIRVPEQKKWFRLTEDWAQFVGARPEVRWNADLTPEPLRQDEDAGPGARRKDRKGEWVIVGDHPMNKYLRR